MLLLLVTSCTETRSNYDGVSTYSKEVKKLLDYKDYDTLVVLKAHDTLFIINNDVVVESLSETYEGAQGGNTFILVFICFIIAFLLGMALAQS